MFYDISIHLNTGQVFNFNKCNRHTLRRLLFACRPGIVSHFSVQEAANA